jgi:hypothetical protein
MFAPCDYPEILGDGGKKETHMRRTSGMWVGGERDSEQTLNILTEQSSTQGRQVQESQIHPEYSEENTHEL